MSRAQACRLCPRMEGRRRVLGDANGPRVARAIVVGTAPGRWGADRTGVPFSGDRSGAMLDALLAGAGLGRDEVFVTNAVLCNPRDARGRNAAPTTAEVVRCQRHLRATLAWVEAPLLVAVGQVAHDALWRLADRRPPPFSASLGRVVEWSADGCGSRLFVATYHCGPRVTAHPARREALLAHWRVVAEVLRR